MVYKLSATLKAHTSDVRAVAGPTPSLVLSGSRDATAISWTKQPSSKEFAQSTVYHAGSRYINSLTYIPPQPDAPAGYVVTGGQDTVINIFSLEEGAKPDPVYSLVGHADNVCALDARPDGTIISGSWDRTARVWIGFQPAFELRGHDHNVWAVLAIENDQFLTGSADRTIKLWRQGKVSNTFSGHKDVVRGLARVPDIGFASCANDSEIIVWTLGGDVVYNLNGHTSFVYSIAALSSGDLVSSGEDRSARIWKSGELVQTITHPAISVWSVAAMPNGDIVTGSSDGAVRIFSEASERWANEADLKAFDDLVASQALPTQQVGDVKKSDLPGLEALGRQGTKDSQVIMVRNGEGVEAYQWSMATGSWAKVGDVVDAAGPSRRQIYDGREYDYVFDVDIQDGVPPLKLPFNVTENPYMAAQKFLEKNELPLTYLDEVVKFIEKNTEGVTLGASSNEFVDPYTGASRYRPGSAPSQGGGGGGAVGGGYDPFTGASSYRPGGQQPQPQQPARSKLLPATAPLSFKQANIDAMRKKILDFNAGFAAELTTATLALEPIEESTLDSIFEFLINASKDPAFDPTKQQQLDSVEVQLIMSLWDRWPASSLFPLIDLARLITAYSPGAYTGDANESLAFFKELFKAAEWDRPWDEPISKLRETNILLVLRAVANAAQFANGVEGWIYPVAIELNRVGYTGLNKNQKVAFATIVLNLSVLAVTGKSQVITPQVLQVLSKLLQHEDSEAEAAYRALVAAGNFAVAAANSGKQSALKPIFAAASSLSSKFKESRFRDIESELKALSR